LIICHYTNNEIEKKPMNIKTTTLINNVRNSLRHCALAVAAAAGLSVGSVQAQTITTVIDLGTAGNGTSVEARAPLQKIGLGSLPPGSLLRSVALNYRLDAGQPYLGSLGPLFADSNGNNGILMIAGSPNDGNYAKSAATTLPWASGEDYDVGVTASATLTAAQGLPAIDLSNYAVWLQTGWRGTWSGSITLEYDIAPLWIRLDTPANGEAFLSGDVISATATLLETTPATGPYNVKFFTRLLPSGTPVERTPTNTGLVYTADLGALAAGNYEIYSQVTDSATPTPATVTSTTHTFTVSPPLATSITLDAAGSATTYGQSVTLTATVSPIPSGGTVRFFLTNGNYFGTAVAVNTTTGKASLSTTMLEAGSNSIEAEYSGFQIYNQSTTSAAITQTVNKAPLTVRALNAVRRLGIANPAFPYQITGFQNGQNFATSGVTGTPMLASTADIVSPAGDYPITCDLGDLSSSNYDFTFVNGILTVKELADTFSVNFYAYGNMPAAFRPNVLMSQTQPAGFGDWLTPDWSNYEVPWNPTSPLAPVTLNSNKASTATFQYKDGRNGWQSFGEPRTTNLGDGSYNMMGSGVNSTLNFGESAGDYLFDMEMTNIPFAVYDVIFYMRGNDGTVENGTGVIKFNGAADRVFTLKPGAFDGNFVEMVDATTEGNYIVYKNVTGTSFTAQTWGTGPGGANHVGPAGFQIRQVVPAGGFNVWATANAPGQTTSQDHDNDGVQNGIEYFMGQAGSSFTAMPSLNSSNVITWPASSVYAGSYEVQTSPDLVTWTNISPKPAPTGGNINYTLPVSLGKQFVRLLVTPTP
jgi:Bacterial Ig-like domain (group 3)/MBG domain (YGX type)